jgi:hypothetical protein
MQRKRGADVAPQLLYGKNIGNKKVLPQLTTAPPIISTISPNIIKVIAVDELLMGIIQPQFGHLSAFLAISLPQALHFIISIEPPPLAPYYTNSHNFTM